MEGWFVNLPGMTDEVNPATETGELTERFRAFSETVDPEPSRALPFALIGITAVALVALVVVVIYAFI
jgi:hypothetical protein